MLGCLGEALLSLSLSFLILYKGSNLRPFPFKSQTREMDLVCYQGREWGWRQSLKYPSQVGNRMDCRLSIASDPPLLLKGQTLWRVTKVYLEEGLHNEESRKRCRELLGTELPEGQSVS